MGRDADEPEPGRDLERFRHYLSLLARLQVEPRLRGRVDLSGVVQQALLEAHQGRARFRGSNDAQTAAWLRKILLNNLADELRKHGAQKRDVALERSLDAALEESSARLEAWLVAEQSSPSQGAIRHEQAIRLAEALAELPDNQRWAVELHHLRGRSLAEIADELQTTKAAVAGLLHRGLKALRRRLGEDEDDQGARE
jgi:RNA polymerase sigma-70 factor (ECF subfamily)